MATSGYTGYTRTSVSDLAQETVAIVAVDLTSYKASGRTRVGNNLPIDISVHVGQIHVIPAIGEQWIITRVRGVWVLDTRLPGNKPSAPDPTQGQVQIGSSGPLELNGGLINVNAPLKLHTADTLDLPDASSVPSGSAMWDSAVNKLVISDGTYWRDSTGNIVLATFDVSVGSSGTLAAAAYARFASTVSLAGTGELPSQAGYLPEFSAQGVLSAAAIPQYERSVSLTGMIIPSATRTSRYFTWNHGTGTLRGTIKAKVPALFTGVGRIRLTFMWKPTGHGALTATTIRQYVRTKNFTSTGTLRATARQKVYISPTPTGHVNLSATTRAKIPARLGGAGAGQLTAIARAKFSRTRAYTGHGALTAAAFAKFSRTRNLTGTGVLTKTAVATQFRLTKNFTGHGQLVGNVPVSFDAVSHGNYSFTHTGRGGPAVLFVGFGNTNGDGTISATYGGTPMTQLSDTYIYDVGIGGTYTMIAVFKIDNPASGAKTIEVSPNVDNLYTATCVCMSYMNASSIGTTVRWYSWGQGYDTITSGNVTSANRERVAQCFVARNGYGFSNYSATSRYSSDLLIAGDIAGASPNVSISVDHNAYDTNGSAAVRVFPL